MKEWKEIWASHWLGEAEEPLILDISIMDTIAKCYHINEGIALRQSLEADGIYLDNNGNVIDEEVSTRVEYEYDDVYVPKNHERKTRNRNNSIARKHMNNITWTGATTATANKKGVKKCSKNHQSFDWKKYDNSINRLKGKMEILQYFNSDPTRL